MASFEMRKVQDALFHVHGLATEDERRAYLCELELLDPLLRIEVESLLEAQSTSGEVSTLNRDDSSVADAAAPPPSIPGYELIRALDSGGFGTVYEARKSGESLGPVAIKVLQPGRRSAVIAARFAREVEFHAQMNHEYVARILDTGLTTAGQPYLMMELVAGSLSIIDYAEREQLTIPQRLALFRKVCEGTHHLHLRGVCHRDLKPGNILVSQVDGQAIPKIIDFGIARAIDTDNDLELTRDGASIGTLGYMSPEQATGQNIDFRTDIYSLGVVLHKLLTGRLPGKEPSRDGSIRRPSTQLSEVNNLDQITRDRGLERPAQLQKLLLGDIDSIVIKALERDPAERYQTVHEFADDLKRQADDEPVLARGASGMYRLAKLLRRHKLASLSLSAAVLALAIGLSLSYSSLTRERRARSELELANTDLERMLHFQRTRIRSIRPARMRTLLRQAVTEQAKRAVTAQSKDEAQNPAILEALNKQLTGINFTSVAMHLLEKSVFRDAEAAIHKSFGDAPIARATLLSDLSQSLARVGLIDRAHAVEASALSTRQTELGAEHKTTLESQSQLGDLSRRLGRFAEAQLSVAKVLEVRQRTLGPQDQLTLDSQHALAKIAFEEGKPKKALTLYEEVITAYSSVLGPDNQKTLSVQVGYASLLTSMGRHAEAEQTLRAVAQGLESILDKNHERTLVCLGGLSEALYAQGKFKEAGELARRVYDELSLQLGNDHPSCLPVANLLAKTLIQEARFADALKVFHELIKAHEEVYGPLHSHTIMVMSNTIMTSLMSGDYPKAVTLGTETVRRARICFPPTNLTLAGVLNAYGRALTVNGQLEAGEAAFLESHGIFVEKLGAENNSTRDTADCLSQVYMAWHKNEPKAGYDAKSRHWQELAKGLVTNTSAAAKDAIQERLDRGEQNK